MPEPAPPGPPGPPGASDPRPPRDPRHPPSAGEAQPLCPSHALVERGAGVSFDVRLWGQPARAFALRFDGQVVAYVNRCAHVPAELDWRPGDFLDAEREHIVCAIHGAVYDPRNGRCRGGPCGRGGLIRIAADERGGMASWYPSADVQPAKAAPPESL